MERSIDWYKNVLNLKLVNGPIEMDESSKLINVARSIFGESTKHLRLAQLISADKFGIELFEFVEPRVQAKEKETSRRVGLLHLAIIDPDVNRIAGLVEKNGGKILAKSTANPKRTIIFCLDPDGNAIELCSSAWDGI